jgi:hypothetical protein
MLRGAAAVEREANALTYFRHSREMMGRAVPPDSALGAHHGIQAALVPRGGRLDSRFRGNDEEAAGEAGLLGRIRSAQ